MNDPLIFDGPRKRSQRTTEQRRLDELNPDKHGQVSWAVIVGIFGVLVAASAIFTFYWITLSQQNVQAEKDIQSLEAEYLSLLLIVGNFSTQCNCSQFNITFPVTFSDAAFHLFDAVDPSKLAKFDVSSLVSPFSQSQLIIQDANGTVAYLGDIPAFPTTFLDDAFTVENAVDGTKKVMFNCSLISLASISLLTIQDASGTIAYLSDIPAPTSVFVDNVFTVQNAIDNSKKVQLFVGLVTTATTQTMTIQDASGTIAYLSDIPIANNGSFADDAFRVQQTLDPTAEVALDLSLVTPGLVSVMTVQATSGTIAYLSDAVAFVDVHINTTRTFPDVGHEGVSSLAALGVTQLQIWVCGGGGGGGGGGDGGGGGGGSSSAVELFFVGDAATLFTNLSCIIGGGGAGGDGSGGVLGGFHGDDGNTTSVIGNAVSSLGGFLELFGYGGGGGLAGDESGGAAGAGGGSGGPAFNNSAGIAGIEGGLAGSLADLSGAFRYPWHAGGGGGGGGPGSTAGSDWIGGGSGGATGITFSSGGGGAGSLFGTGGDGGPIENADGQDGGLCAGGGGSAGTVGVDFSGDGGDGHIFIRYWLL